MDIIPDTKKKHVEHNTGGSDDVNSSSSEPVDTLPLMLKPAQETQVEVQTHQMLFTNPKKLTIAARPAEDELQEFAPKHTHQIILDYLTRHLFFSAKQSPILAENNEETSSSERTGGSERYRETCFLKLNPDKSLPKKLFSFRNKHVAVDSSGLHGRYAICFVGVYTSAQTISDDTKPYLQYLLLKTLRQHKSDHGLFKLNTYLNGLHEHIKASAKISSAEKSEFSPSSVVTRSDDSALHSTNEKMANDCISETSLKIIAGGEIIFHENGQFLWNLKSGGFSKKTPYDQSHEKFIEYREKLWLPENAWISIEATEKLIQDNPELFSGSGSFLFNLDKKTPDQINQPNVSVENTEDLNETGTHRLH